MAAQKHTANYSARYWVMGMLAVLAICIVAGVYWNRSETIRRVQFSETTFVDSTALQHTQIPTGGHPDSLNIPALTSQLTALAYVQDVEFGMEPDGTFIVTISERQPLGLLADASPSAYVDSNGVILPPAGQTPNVPLVYGFNGIYADTLTTDAFKSVSQFLVQLKHHPAADATISEVAWNDAQGVVTLSNEGNVRMIFGRNDFDRRLRNWEAFNRQVVRSKGMQALESVDFRFEGQIVSREK